MSKTGEFAAERLGFVTRGETERRTMRSSVETSMDVRAIVARTRALGRGALDELSAKQVLAVYGINVPRSLRIARTDELDNVLKTLSPPLALKVISPNVLHKSDVGGVRLYLSKADEIRAAIDEMAARMDALGHRVDGFLIEEMARGGHEIVIGGVKDPNFGQLVMFGLGGIFVEVLRDISFRICPINRFDAVEMIHEIRGAPILAGARNGVAISEDMLVDALMAVGGENGLLMALGDEVAEVDINPLIVTDGTIIAVDARIILVEGTGDAG